MEFVYLVRAEMEDGRSMFEGDDHVSTALRTWISGCIRYAKLQLCFRKMAPCTATAFLRRSLLNACFLA